MATRRRISTKSRSGSRFSAASSRCKPSWPRRAQPRPTTCIVPEVVSAWLSEIGRAPREVIDRAVQDVLSPTMRHDQPRAFGFVPSAPTWPAVLVDYLVASFNVNAATWLFGTGSPAASPP